MSAPIAVGWCREDEVPAVRTLFDSHWRAGYVLARDETLLRWQFDAGRLPEPPPGAALSLLVARRGDELLGCIGLIPFTLNVRGATVPGAWLGNWLAVPAVRTEGVALRLLWAALERAGGAPWTVGANAVSQAVFGRLGFECLPRVPRLVGVVDPKQAGALAAAVSPGVDPPALRAALARCALREDAGDGLRPWMPSLAPAWDAAWARLAPGLVGGARDAAFLAWRYLAHPRFAYRLDVAWGPEGPGGLLVTRTEQVRDRGERVLRVLDLVGDASALALLAGGIARIAREAGAAMVDWYGSWAPAAAALRAAGCVDETELGEGVVVPARLQPLEGGRYALNCLVRAGRIAGLERGAVLREPGFYVTKADGDMDRPN